MLDAGIKLFKSKFLAKAPNLKLEVVCSIGQRHSDENLSVHDASRESLLGRGPGSETVLRCPSLRCEQGLGSEAIDRPTAGMHAA